MANLEKTKNLLVTGGAGFIGSNFIRYVFAKTGFQGRVINIDKLTYAGNPASLADLAEKWQERYVLEKADICDKGRLQEIIIKHQVTADDIIVHFAAESHVDRSISGPEVFITSNVLGTFTLLEIAREHQLRFHHVSTDEVYGSLGDTGLFHESTPYDPRSPYSASKAASDHLVRAYHHTYGLPVTLSNCSNNYGPYHFPEKLIPLMILNALEGKKLPVYGDGKNVRDWLYVEDHASAIWTILTKGKIGETYNVGGEAEMANIAVVFMVCDLVDEEQPLSREDKSRFGIETRRDLITYVKDRPGHDRRYAIDCGKIKSELGWKQSLDFQMGLRHTVKWYLDNAVWVNSVRSGEYRSWLEKNYAKR